MVSGSYGRVAFESQPNVLSSFLSKKSLMWVARSEQLYNSLSVWQAIAIFSSVFILERVCVRWLILVDMLRCRYIFNFGYVSSRTGH